jgi:hypothetical protein
MSRSSKCTVKAPGPQVLEVDAEALIPSMDEAPHGERAVLGEDRELGATRVHRR